MSKTITPPENALAFLKADLGFFDANIPSILEQHLQGLIFTAQERIRENYKIVLKRGNANDDQLVAMYAAWLYRNRITGEGMKPMLTQELRDRQVNQALGGQA